MKNYLIVILTLICTTAKAQQQTLNEKWGNVMLAIEQVESRGKSNLVSRDGRFVGCLQMSEICVRQCNQILGYKKYSSKDRYNRAKSHEMFIVFQEYFNPKGDVEFAIRLWNSGDIRCMERKAKTERYYQSVSAKMTQMAKN